MYFVNYPGLHFIVPPGFTCIQLPGQPEPNTLWPTARWEDISSQYAGLFFRAIGGDSKGFGQVQDDNAPRVTEVTGHHVANGDWRNPVQLEPGKLSNNMFSGCGGQWNWWVHQFRVSDGEVRPRNKAVRIWKRTT